MNVIPTLYRGMVRAGRRRATQLQTLEASGLPSSPYKLSKAVVSQGHGAAIERWTADDDLMFDINSSAKWTKFQLGLYGGNVTRAVRSRFDEQVDATAQAAAKVYWRQRLGPDADVDRIVASTTKQKVDDALLGLRLLDELNEFTDACIEAMDVGSLPKGEGKADVTQGDNWYKMVQGY
uniref:Uncharacterized protein n=1 Tax=Eutreptiella gymnastica TaxID=73025 RepID=A0A7S4FEF7_9EUGL